MIGTALLVLIGLSLVILMFGGGTPMARLIRDEGLRRFITGFLFGTTGASKSQSCTTSTVIATGCFAAWLLRVFRVKELNVMNAPYIRMIRIFKIAAGKIIRIQAKQDRVQEMIFIRSSGFLRTMYIEHRIKEIYSVY